MQLKNIFLKQWISTDRCESVTIIKSVEEFIESLHEELLFLLCHSFTAAQQPTYLTELECNLQTGEFMALYDFVENYPFILQDEVHSIRTVHKTPSIHL
jgi:hypothetical protein